MRKLILIAWSYRFNSFLKVILVHIKELNKSKKKVVNLIYFLIKLPNLFII